MNMDRGRKLLKQLKHLVESYFPEVDVEYQRDCLTLRVKDGNARRSP